MIALMIAACLHESQCREFTLLYDAREVSLMTCMIGGQPQVAAWHELHPDWQVRRWYCTLADPRAAAI